MSKFYERLLVIKGDPTQQVIDLILFLGYFSICLYVGGVAYESSYNNVFHLDVKTNPRNIGVAVFFVTNVLLRSWYLMIPSLLYVFLFIGIIYASRYVWRPWFGYVLLSLLFYLTFLVCGYIGNAFGRADAIKDTLEKSTSKPEIKLYGVALVNKYSLGGFHLLTENETRFFVFEPQGVEGSLIVVHAVKKSNVQHFEVFIK